MPDTKCGTYAGWNTHHRHKEPVCDACREAQRQYQANRRRNPEKRAIEYRDLKASEHARRELARRHHNEYRRLYLMYKRELASADGA